MFLNSGKCALSPSVQFERPGLTTNTYCSSGTGLLSLVFSPWVQHYTATDLDHLLPLIRKNIAANLGIMQKAAALPGQQQQLKNRHKSPRAQRVKAPTSPSPSSNAINAEQGGGGSSSSSSSNGNVTVEGLDWLELQRCSPESRLKHFKLDFADPPDLILAVDCVYNPALLPALVCALNAYSRPGHTVAVVAVELRAADVIQEFLDLWAVKGIWEVWRLASSEEGSSWLGAEFAVWMGWRIGPV
jgi:protein N-lysine methyltransferase METTL21D